jgi:hypothetical protein
MGANTNPIPKTTANLHDLFILSSTF